MVSTRSASRPPSTPEPPATSTSPTTIEMTTNISKSGESIINTENGTIRVRPYRSGSNHQLKAMLSFTPRVSPFDRENAKSQRDEFRGFFVLFWICLALLFIRTSIQSWEDKGTLLSLQFGRLITRDAFVLALADGLMVASMLLSVPFVKCLQYRYFNYYWTGVIIQHTFQSCFLAVAIWWGYAREWYWVQSGFLVLHCLASLMKIHSYMAHNGMLSMVYLRLQEEKRTLDQYLKTLPGGKEAVLKEAASRHAELEAMEASSETGNTPIGTPAPGTPGAPALQASPFPPPASGSTSYRDEGELMKKLNGVTASTTSTESSVSSATDLRKRATVQRQRSIPTAVEQLPKPQAGLPLGTSLEPSHSTTPHTPRPIQPLAWSSDSHVALLARNIDQMEDELRSNGPRGLTWPQNVTYFHFVEFMFFPTLVYQLEYPRTNSIRPLYVVEKVIATFGTFSLIYLLTEHYIIPYTPKPETSLIRCFMELSIPMILNYLLIFYIIFECVCTGFAELSYFADREFYQDWWNSTTWDEFSRKWNKPVHTFLLRHVYASTMSGLRLSKWGAMLATFLLSALCHELVMAVVTKKIRPYLFLLQMIQLPMIIVGRIPIVRRNKTIGNIVFWFGLMMGFPLLAICYLVF